MGERLIRKPKQRPVPYQGVQVNHCRNTLCVNFAVSPAEKARKATRDFYRLVGSANQKALLCMHCGLSHRIKSNKAAFEQYVRVSKYLNPKPDKSCPHCGNSDQTRFQRFGTSDAGSVRYRCKECKKTFSIRNPVDWKQKSPEKNELILRLLLNKMPMRRILETASISPSTLYRKLFYARDRLVEFSGQHEPRLETLAVEHQTVCTDRQDFVVNWGSHFDRRGFILRATASADLDSGYVLALNANVETDVDASEIELKARKCGDYDLPIILRQYAAYWLMEDYADHAKSKQTTSGRHPTARQVYSPNAPSVFDRDDDYANRQPVNGIQVRNEYVQLSHFMLVERLTRSAKKITLAMDPDTGFRGSALSCFSARLQQGTAQAFHVRFDEALSIDERDLALSEARHQLGVARAEGRDKERARALTMLEDQIMVLQGNIEHPPKWIKHPMPSRAEPNREIAHLSPKRGQRPAEVAEFGLTASLHSVDRFFMLTRRRISLLERPIKTPSREDRTWHGYSPYDPGVACALLEIMRTAHNYHWTGKDKKTPAMRLGLMTKPITLTALLGAKT